MKRFISANVLLLLFGSAVGIGAGLAIGLFLVSAGGIAGQPEGAVFENPEQFRRAMLERDERDVQKDDSVSLRSIVKPHKSDNILYTLRPNLDVMFQGVRVRTNSFGMRGPERAAAKPAGVYRIALLGDSFAFGWGVEQEKIFSAVLEAELNRRLPDGPRVEVLNFGTPGYSTFQETAVYVEKGRGFQADAVLVFFIENDWGLPFFIQNFNEPEKLEGAHRFHELKKQAASPEAEERGDVLSGKLNPNHALLQLGEVAAEDGIPVWVTINPKNNVEKDSSRLWALRASPNISYLRLRPPFVAEVERRSIKGKELQLPNDPHPNAVWHEIIGTLLAEQIAGQVSAGRG